MTIEYTSDLHLDWIFGCQDIYSHGQIKRVLERMGFIETKADILIIGGDLGHYNNQNIAFLKHLAENHYKHVIFVHGNHDLYLSSKNQINKYDCDSFKRLHELREHVDKIHNVHFLDGEMISIDGIRIAGGSLWYDYSYGLQRGLEAWEVQKYFIEHSNDANMVMQPTLNIPHVYNHFSKPKTFIDNLAYATEQKAKLLKVVKDDDPDIIVSHIPPDHELCEGTGKTQNEPLFAGSLYSTDTSEFDPYISGKTWIFGHIHDVVQKELRGCQFMAAPFGYYRREKNNPFGSFTIKKIRYKNVSLKETTIKKL